ncbi:MAG: DUF2946 family protein [Pseudomonadota bacterium]
MQSLATNKLISLPGGFRLKPSVRNQFVAGLAILGLYLQLAAAALCMAGFTSGPDLSGFPICHSSSGDQAPASKSGVPQQQQHSCPFCALHCHAALVLAAAIVLAALASVATPVEPRQLTALPRLRFAIAAQPRGPPLFS